MSDVQRPRGAELLFCFDIGPPPTTPDQHEFNSGSTSCFYCAANTYRHPDLVYGTSVKSAAAVVTSHYGTNGLSADPQ